MFIGKEILARRLALKATQKDLEAESGVPQSHISRIELGNNRDPRHSTVQKLEGALERMERRSPATTATAPA